MWGTLPGPRDFNTQNTPGPRGGEFFVPGYGISSVDDQSSRFKSRFPMVMCFAWCNSDMLDFAPERQFEQTTSSPSEEILSYLENANQSKRFFKS